MNKVNESHPFQAIYILKTENTQAVVIISCRENGDWELETWPKY
jgi:hypothetical protein